MSGGAFRIAEGYVEVTADREAYDRSIDRLKTERTIVKVGLGLDEGDFTARLDRLTRDRLMTVKLRLDDAALQRLRLDNISVKISPNIPDAALNRVKAQLDRLTADRVVNIRASVDTRVGAQEIRNLTQRRQVRIGIDVDTRVAADSIANLTRRRQMTVVANANTTEARARIDALARNRTTNLDVNVRGGLGSLTGSGGGISALTGQINKLVVAAVAAGPTLASLGESLIQMGPAAAIAAPAVLSVAAAFAAVKLGTSGISDAFKAAFAPATKSAASAASSIRAVQNAQEALVKAERNVKDTEEQVAAARIKAARDVADAQQALKDTVVQVADSNHAAAEQVASAERDLTNAQKAAIQAQKDLTQARKDAAMELEDLNNRLTDSKLSQRADELALADAEKQLAADQAAGLDQSSEQYQKDKLARDQAAQALKEQQTETQRLQEQADAANKAGVEGSQQVIDAKQGVADANQTVADKTQALQDAQTAADRAATDGAERIAKAERDLSDARAAQVKQATDGARQIADANQAVADAARNLADAQNSGALAVNKTANALAVLAPNARAFVQAVIDQRAAWRSLKLDVQNALFAGMASLFNRLTTSVLPSLRAGLTGTAGILNTTARNAGNAVVQLGKTGMLRKLFDGLNGAMRPLTRIPGQILTAIVQLGIAAAPAFKRLTTAFAKEADKISKKLGDAFKSGALTDKINAAVDIAKSFGKLLGDIFGTLNNLFKAAAAGGGDALGTLGDAFAELRKVTGMPEVQKALTSIFTAINTIATLLTGTLGTALGQLIIGLAPVADAITQVLTSLGDTGPLIGGLIAAFNPFLGILTLIAPMIGDLAKPLVGLVKATAPLLDTLSTFASGLLTALSPVLGALIDVLTAVLQALAPVFAQVAPVLLQVVQAIAGPLTQVIQGLIPAIGPIVTLLTSMDLAMLPLAPQLMRLLPPLGQLTLALVNLAVQVLLPLTPIITGLAVLLTDVLGGALTILIPVITTVIGWITAFTTAITAAVDWVVDKFKWLYDTLVGHSIIPDLVTAIIGWFNNLWTWAKNIFNGLLRDITSIWNSLWSRIRATWNSFWSGLSSAISSARSWIGNQFSTLRTAVSSTWSGLWGGVRDTFSSIMRTVQSRISDFSNGTKRVFSGLRDSLGNIWSGIQSKFASPVRFVVGTVYNNGIRKMWDTIASKVGLPQIPSIKLGFNRGGIVPGQGSGDTVDAKLTPGERILSLRQVAMLGGHAALDALVGRSDTDRRGRPGRFGIGGIVGDITGTVKTVGGVVSSGADWITGIVVGGLQAAARKGITAVVNPLINRIPVGNNALGDLIKGIPRSILNGILDVLGKKDKDATASGQISYNPSAGVAQWGPVILRALAALRQSAGWLGTVERRMNQESGGNPTVVNRWDSNWIAGTPSVGLMQVIGPTFKAYSGLFRDTGPFSYGVSVDPMANTYAGLNYALHRYGSLSALNRPGGYDSGGLLMPGATMAVNRTGRPERVLNADHTARLDALLAGGGGVTIEAINVSGTFDFSSPADRRRAANALVVEIKEALRNFDRARR